MMYLQGVMELLVYLQMIESDADKNQFEQVYLQYRGLMFYVANRILKNEQDAEDAVHQAFVKIAENIEKISEPVCPKTRALVVTIVERTAIDLYRKRRRRGTVEFNEETVGLQIELPDATGLPAAVARLPARYRQVILLKYDNGYRNEEIAQILGLKSANVQKLIQRAKAKLKEMLEEEEAQSGNLG
jgi:RNA polymerase sigma-70 factor (ECF subfamily)